MKTAEQYWIDKYDCLPYSTSSKATIELMQEYGDYVKSHMKAKNPGNKTSRPPVKNRHSG